MHSVLLVVEKPTEPTIPLSNWHTFLHAIEGFGPPRPQIQRLADNVWLIPLQPNGLMDLTILVMAAAHEHRLACKTHFFDKEPEWCRVEATR
jgi:hypothetical protein